MAPRPRRSRLAPLLLPLAWMAAAAGGIALVRAAPAGLFGWVVGAVLGLAIAWILVSVLWPARAERTCPRCGERALGRLEEDSTVGVRCGSCGFVDEAATAWYIAEEQGPLEELVLASRGRSERGRAPRPGERPDGGPARRRPPAESPVDSPLPRD